jgi:hypothetical protein
MLCIKVDESPPGGKVGGVGGETKGEAGETAVFASPCITGFSPVSEPEKLGGEENKLAAPREAIGESGCDDPSGVGDSGGGDGAVGAASGSTAAIGLSAGPGVEGGTAGTTEETTEETTEGATLTAGAEARGESGVLAALILFKAERGSGADVGKASSGSADITPAALSTGAAGLAETAGAKVVLAVGADGAGGGMVFALCIGALMEGAGETAAGTTGTAGFEAAAERDAVAGGADATEDGVNPPLLTLTFTYRSIISPILVRSAAIRSRRC